MKIDIKNNKIKEFAHVIYGDVFRPLNDNKQDYWIRIKDYKIDKNSINTHPVGNINCIRIKDGDVGYYNDTDEVEVISCVLKELN